MCIGLNQVDVTGGIYQSLGFCNEHDLLYLKRAYGFFVMAGNIFFVKTFAIEKSAC